jgi:hypothetical protein
MPDHDFPLGRIALAGGAIVLSVVLTVIAVLVWLHARHIPAGGERMSQPYDLTVPGPPLPTAPQPDLQAYLQAKQQRLHSIGWVDAGAGIAHIPIEDAMTLVAAKAASAAEGRR